VVAGSEELISWIWGFAVLQGANASPYDATNALRGLRTLAARLRQQTETAQRIAEMLEGRAEVAAVSYPGLPSHPQFELARRQMRSAGTLLSFDVHGDESTVTVFVESLRLGQLATSLGGPETLLTHPASTTHVNLSPAELDAAGITAGTVRMSVGLEHGDDLVADLEQALDRIAAVS
jgi:cystathionine beta-lyase/cystathionine gamma-synthase